MEDKYKSTSLSLCAYLCRTKREDAAGKIVSENKFAPRDLFDLMETIIQYERVAFFEQYIAPIFGGPGRNMALTIFKSTTIKHKGAQWLKYVDEADHLYALKLAVEADDTKCIESIEKMYPEKFINMLSGALYKLSPDVHDELIK
jgi:hypothetical protein